MTEIKFAIVPGHNSVARGAVSVDGTSENPWAVNFCAHLLSSLKAKNINSVIVNRVKSTGEFTNLAEAIKATGATHAIEVHFDVAEGPSHGPLGLCWPGSVEGRRLAMCCTAAVCDATGLPSRGVREQALSWCGYYLSYKYTDIPHIILEVVDGTDSADWSFVDEDREIKHIADTIASYIQVSY